MRPHARLMRRLEESFRREAELEETRRRYPFEVRRLVPTARALELGPPYHLFLDFEGVREANFVSRDVAERYVRGELRRRGGPMQVVEVDPDGNARSSATARARRDECTELYEKMVEDEEGTGRDGEDPPPPSGGEAPA